MQQIVLNLAGNAIKFTEAGRVDLCLRRTAEGQVEISVRDTGPGLDAEQQSRLFRRFEQGEGNLTARRHGGSGLGLAICQELASAMGGRIAVDSAPGAGSTFRLQVPLPDALAPPESASAAAASTAALDLLVVEDDPVVAQVVCELLRTQGHRVEHAAHGLAALAALREQRFALVFLDLDLPGLSGFEVARMVGTGEGAPPLVALSARADPQVEERTAQAGMRAFLRKPVRGEDLAEAVRRWAR
jgi:CheY-like chemotaxis protein